MRLLLTQTHPESFDKEKLNFYHFSFASFVQELSNSLLPLSLYQFNVLPQTQQVIAHAEIMIKASESQCLQVLLMLSQLLHQQHWSLNISVLVGSSTHDLLEDLSIQFG